MWFPRTDFTSRPLHARADVAVNKTYAVVDFIRPSIELKDIYLFPLKVSNPQITLKTIPSNRHSDSWIPLAEACNVKGSNPARPDGKYLDNCSAKQLLDPAKASTISETQTSFTIQDSEASYYAKGVVGTDRLVIGNDDSIVQTNYPFNFAKAANTSFGIMGLGEDSPLLRGMKERGEIAARAFSLWMGTDISYRQNWDRNARTGPFPGSLVLGGYDFRRQLEGSDFLRGGLVNGMPRIKITGINVHTPDTHVMLSGDEAVEAQIDSSLPWIYLPDVITTRLRDARGNTVNNDSTLTRARKFGNITMTLELLSEPAVGAREINVTFPESIWDQDYSYVRSPKPSFKALMPVTKRPKTPALLGRPFLKAVYMAINYDTAEFQLAPAGYNPPLETDIQPFNAVAVDGSDKALSFPTQVADSNPNTPSNTATQPAGKSSIPVGAIAGGVVGGLAGLVFVVALILFFLRKRRTKRTLEKSGSGSDGEGSGVYEAISAATPSNPNTNPRAELDGSWEQAPRHEGVAELQSPERPLPAKAGQNLDSAPRIHELDSAAR